MAFGGNSINAVLLDGTQTIFGAKTFSTAPKFPTQAAGSNNTYGATTAFVSTAITNAIAANCVTLTGAQTVAGIKTFTSLCKFNGSAKALSAITVQSSLNDDVYDSLYLAGDDPCGIAFKNHHVVFGSTGSDDVSYCPTIDFLDNNKKTLSKIYPKYDASKLNTLQILMYKATSTTDTQSASFSFNYDSTGAWFRSWDIKPASDNSRTLGDSSLRWKQLYAGTATINTSDEREKQQIADVPENVLDAWADVNFCQFKFNDSVAEKGDAARLHTGLIAQRIKSVFEAHGLDAAAYGLFCHDSWAESEDVPAGDRYALRYEECLTLEAAYQRRRADRIEARLEALEKALIHD